MSNLLLVLQPVDVGFCPIIPQHPAFKAGLYCARSYGSQTSVHGLALVTSKMAAGPQQLQSVIMKCLMLLLTEQCAAAAETLRHRIGDPKAENILGSPAVEPCNEAVLAVAEWVCFPLASCPAQTPSHSPKKTSVITAVGSLGHLWKQDVVLGTALLKIEAFLPSKTSCSLSLGIAAWEGLSPSTRVPLIMWPHLLLFCELT